MAIESKIVDSGVALVTLSGRLVFGREVEKLETLVKELLQQGRRRFIFDATALDYADSSGIGTLVAALTDIKHSDGDLRLAGATPRLQRLLNMTGVDALIPQYASVDEAAAG